MHFSLFEKADWIAATLAISAVLVVVFVRHRARQFPILTSWLVFLFLRSIALYLIYLYSTTPDHLRSGWHWYMRTWVTGVWLDFFFQLGLVFEIAGIVLRPTGTWVRDARGHFAAVGVTGVVAAALLAWLVSPPAWSVPFAWQIRGNLFTSLVICELFVVMSLTANRLGLGWRNHVMAVGQGLTAWTGIMVITTSIQSWFGTRRFYDQIDLVRALAYTLAMVWIALQLWRDEPQRQPISADLQEYILALHRRVEYDLRRLDAPH